MAALVDRRQPLTNAALSLARRICNWTPVAPCRHSPLEGNGLRRNVGLDGAPRRIPSAMLKPSTRETVAISCHGDDWP